MAARPSTQNGVHELRLFPQSEPVYFDLLEAAADNLTRAAEILLELATDLTDVKVKASRLNALEDEGDRITRQMVTRLHSAFLAHLDPDDLYVLAVGLNDVSMRSRTPATCCGPTRSPSRSCL